LFTEWEQEISAETECFETNNKFRNNHIDPLKTKQPPMGSK